ncbi:MAG: hypothetical protein ACOCV1_05430 [Bacillota bacterium]
MEKSKIKINIETGEIEIEGTEEFVKEQINNIENIRKLVKGLKKID